jgi:hypothetical protein
MSFLQAPRDDDRVLGPEYASTFFEQEDLLHLRSLGPKLEKVRREKEDAERKLAEFGSRSRALAEQQAVRRREAVEQVMGGTLEISIPTIESSTDVLREARARLESAVKAAAAAERDIVATYRAHLATARRRAQVNAHRHLTRHAAEVTRAIAAVAAMDDLPGTLEVGQGELARIYLPDLAAFAPAPDRRSFPLGLTGEPPKLLDRESLAAATDRARAGLATELDRLAGPLAEGFWR